jgi:hypothetical protein
MSKAQSYRTWKTTLGCEHAGEAQKIDASGAGVICEGNGGMRLWGSLFAEVKGTDAILQLLCRV